MKHTPMMACIKRLRKDELLQPIDDWHDENIVQYYGKKKPMMPTVPITAQVPDMYANMSQERAEECDFAFFLDIQSCDQCPEFNGYNMKLSREQGHSLNPKTMIVYLPFIDRPPSDSATLMMTILRAQEVSSIAGQKFVIFTADQQLYRVELHAIWESEARLNNIFLRLGGMQILMSYCGCISTLMADTGIVEVLSVTFGGYSKILVARSALRM